ncbi:hypothetical protein T4A_9344 [Trichinella pseudospiralis]|uniref:Uncharacterized protein n=1 Tax=Trichinella pseudospiralis TaxID=6337 RepID=A0A0V1DR95_TRIPS|nr:hypothetical protein T4E_7264 [Trichinella pseudospiralis]KRY64080.1 hypothetical protein T4A_9344 [Trichinella pseudospiralis]
MESEWKFGILVAQKIPTAHEGCRGVRYWNIPPESTEKRVAVPTAVWPCDIFKRVFNLQSEPWSSNGRVRGGRFVLR